MRRGIDNAIVALIEVRGALVAEPLLDALDLRALLGKLTLLLECDELRKVYFHLFVRFSGFYNDTVAHRHGRESYWFHRRCYLG